MILQRLRLRGRVMKNIRKETLDRSYVCIYIYIRDRDDSYRLWSWNNWLKYRVKQGQNLYNLLGCDIIAVFIRNYIFKRFKWKRLKNRDSICLSPGTKVIMREDYRNEIVSSLVVSESLLKYSYSKKSNIQQTCRELGIGINKCQNFQLLLAVLAILYCLNGYLLICTISF